MSNRKKARLQTEARPVMAFDANADASNMETDEDVPPEWKPFLESAVDFDATIVHDIVKTYDSLLSKEAERIEGLHQLFPEESIHKDWKFSLWRSVRVRYPGFTMEHARMALEILEAHSAESTHFSGFYVSQSVAQCAFKVPYATHPDDDEFVAHLELQRSRLDTSPSSYAPYFAVIQSSGYGKSRLVTALLKKSPYRVIYWTFGSEVAYPSRNVAFNPNVFKRRDRKVLEHAMKQAIEKSIWNPDEPFKIELPPKKTQTDRTGYEDRTSTVFVVDEASRLLEDDTADGISFFRCLRRAFDSFKSERSWLFFVVMATDSSITALYPDFSFDAPLKPVSGSNEENEGPLDPFILGASFRINNNRDTLLRMSVNECHQPSLLYSMGRPLWKALLAGQPTRMSAEQLLQYAQMKLLSTNVWRSSSSPDIHQSLALLAVRLCLSITPDYRYAPALVASHMATAVSISPDRFSTILAYPSEPVLAVAAKRATKQANCLSTLISFVKQMLAFGIVHKGYKGEVIVRLLNLLAMDKAMGGSDVLEVDLRTYLKHFHRDGENARIDDEFIDSLSDQEGWNEDEQKALLEKHGLFDSVVQELRSSKQTHENQVDTILDGKVCFTHFVYLSNETKDGSRAMITHDLLRYAYRRTAAVIVDEGRRGIDRIIPVRIEGDKYIGLIVQDKNRLSDTLGSLVKADNDETHWKVNMHFFLTKEEQLSFTRAGVSLDKHWPALLFAIGTDEVGTDAVKALTRRRLRSDGNSETTEFPCIVLTGLNYFGLMDEEVNRSLVDLRVAELGIDEGKEQYVPITYGL